ncbi:MAG: RibD family protein [Leptospiraceae bacterium]|nr:RibD family protein [Leptospiraceae bacterium]
MFLALNMAMTLDGKIARPDGKWYGLSSRTDKKRMDRYRADSEILILGKNSILNDNPVIQIRYVEKAKNPRPVILIRKGSLPKTKRVFLSEEKPIIYCVDENYSEVKTELEECSEIESLGKELLPDKVMENLKSRGYNTALLEGGGTLNYSFFSLDLIDRIYLTLVPFLIGDSSLPTIANGKQEMIDFDQKKWSLSSCEKIEDEVFFQYDRLRS